MRTMAAGLVSPVFAGREAELTLLAGAFEDAAGGTPRTVLTGAEAGGGKSRLVAEFTATVGDRAMVLAGGCVELGAGGLPYAPFTAALRQLVRARGAADVAGLLPDQAAGELGVLLPDFGTPSPGAEAGTARARLFEVLLTLLETLAEQQPLVLVVEDVHWADRSTCDLLSFLVRNIQQARVLLVVTFRSDELNRNDLVRPLLAGLARAEGVSRLELARLSRAQAAVQLEGILGRPPGAALIGEVYQRGGGIPLLTEALVHSDGTVSAELPVSLRDLLLAAVAVLPERTQQVLRIAAAGGVRLGHRLLAAVTGLDDAALTAALRPAVDAKVLVSDSDEAIEILDEVLGLDLPPLGRCEPLVIRAQIAVARGDEATAERMLAELRSLPAGVQAESQRLLSLARLDIDDRLAGGDLAGALDAGRAALTRSRPADPRYLWPLLAAAMRACAEASVVSLPPAACDPARLRKDLELRAGSADRPGPLHEAWAATFAAEAARADGHPDLAGWDAAASAWAALAQPEQEAYALLRAASAASAGGNREGAAVRLARLADLAGRLGARPLLERIGSLARRARVDLPALPGPRRHVEPSGAAPFGLTEREREVLRLVAAGRGNRDIAAELFISPKTASVHVSNILGKLGVSSRGEAAATAYRQHLLDDS